MHIQLPLDYERSRRNDGALRQAGVLNDNQVISALFRHRVELLLEALFSDIADRCEDAQAVEETRCMVVATQGTQNVAFGKGSLHLLREEIGRKERGGHCVVLD